MKSIWERGVEPRRTTRIEDQNVARGTRTLLIVTIEDPGTKATGSVNVPENPSVVGGGNVSPTVAHRGRDGAFQKAKRENEPRKQLALLNHLQEASTPRHPHQLPEPWQTLLRAPNAVISVLCG